MYFQLNLQIISILNLRISFFKSGQLLAQLPKLLRLGLITRHSRQTPRLAIHKILSRHLLQLLRHGQMQSRLTSLLGVLEERLDDKQQSPTERYGDVAPDPRVDHAGVQAVGSDFGAFEASGELAGEEDVGVLGHVVVEEWDGGSYGVDFFEVQRNQAVELGSHYDYSGWCRTFHQI